MDQHNFCYPGDELALFAHATRWKRYWSRAVSPFLGARVLEVGAGIGTNTALLYSGSHKEWICLEPDAKMVEVMRERQRAGHIPASCEIRCGTLADIEDCRHFDTILYIDVLEHIEGDRHEVVQAAGRLAAHGRLVVLAPSYHRLFSPFDVAVGHYRRYDRRSLQALTPDLLRVERVRYLDAVGLLASLANKVVLRASMPTLRQIATWDRMMVPLSRLVDPLILFRAGKSILMVWQRV